MIYLSGVVHKGLMGHPEIGFILTPDMGNRVPPGATWAADSGCYAQGDAFSLDRYLDWLVARTPFLAKCLFAPAPDVVGNAQATWDRSSAVLPLLRELGYRAALVAQDGLERPKWDAFDALFIGGTTEWKLGPDAAALAKEAKARGKHVHMGRVNSYRRMFTAHLLGCNSVDGTFLRRAPDQNVPRLRSWLNRPFLPLAARVA